MTLLCLLFLIACHQDDPVTPLGDPYLSWNAFYEENGVKPQTFTLDAAAGGTFTGKKGMVLTIPPNAFVNKIGRKISGEVTVRFCEFLSLKDMFLSGLNTMSRDAILVTAGSFKFEAEQDGESLTIAHPEGAHVLIPPEMNVGMFQDAMFPFIWTNGFAGEDSTFSWRFISDLPIWRDPTSDNAYDMIFTGAGLYNCDAFYSWNTFPGTSFTDFKVSVKGTDIENTRVIILVKDMASMVELTVREGETKKTYDTSIPVGMEGKLLVVSMEDENLKFGYQDIKIVGKELFEVEVATGTTNELKALIDNPF